MFLYPPCFCFVVIYKAMMFWARYILLWTLVAAAVLGCDNYVECCVEEERLALLDIKAYMQSYSDPKPDDQYFLLPWYNSSNTNDCCEWDGVRCNASTGRVTQLDLYDKVKRDETDNVKKPWMFNVTLFRPFTQLISLDLSYNFINGLVEHDGSTNISTLKNLRILNLDSNSFETDYLSLRVLTSLETLKLVNTNLNNTNFLLKELPSLTKLQTLAMSDNNISTGIQGICKLKNLVELDLSGNLLHGVFPSCLEKLSSLQTFDLSLNKFSGNLPKVLLSLRSLKFLYLDGNSFEGKLPSELSSLRFLENLDLSDNHFEGKFSLTSLSSLSKLSKLQLSGNTLEVQFGGPAWRPKFQLQYLALGGCNLNKTFDTCPNFWSLQTNLSTLDLSSNNLHMAFPVWLFNRSSKLTYLYLANNSLIGNLELPRSVNLSLEFLDISNNRLHGKLPERIGLVFPQLLYLNLSGNHFEGPIPPSIALIRELSFLDLSYNYFSGKLPRRLLSDCNFMRILQLSDNNLQGDIIPEDMNLTYLQWLKLSNNRFGGTIKDSLLKSSGSLIYLDMSNNSITGRLPPWIGNFSALDSLSISQNNLQGHIPTEICNLQLEYLDLSENNFSGSIPSCPNSCFSSHIHLRSNSLSGVIPNTLSTCSSTLQTLDLRDNQLSGGISLWIHKLSKLIILMLAGNNLHGPIPHQLCQLSGINILDLSHNGLFGGIPICVGNLSFGMKIPTYRLPQIASYAWRRGIKYTFYAKPDEVEFLSKNQLLTYKGTNLVLMSSLDLSSNNLTGDIPPQLGKLERLHALNLSSNRLWGSIPTQFSNLKQVESLDLSFNHLSGKIPSQLVLLTFLETFNVSYNNLTGRVPETAQFATFDERNYYGNPGLSGYNPIKALPPATGTEEDEDEGDHAASYMVDFLWSFGMSCVTMFLATILILYINPQWRGALFDFVDSRILCWFTEFKLNLY